MESRERDFDGSGDVWWCLKNLWDLRGSLKSVRSIENI